MHPTMFTIPFLPPWLGEIKSYGVMMMIAFLSGIWLACRRAYKTQANPDTVLNMGFIALIFGVIGARAMFVIHYWDTNFANQPNPLSAVFDVRGGGLEFWGGPILVIPALMIYLRYVAKVSVRWYLDITMPSLAWGLAITRIGCFLNGCCWGAICVDQHDPALERATIPWAVQFPYGSPAMVQHYRYGRQSLPKELIWALPSGQSQPVPREYINALAGEEGATLRQLKEENTSAWKLYNERKNAGADVETLEKLQARAEDASAAVVSYLGQNIAISAIDKQCRAYDLTPEQLAQLSAHYPSLPVHPTQLYAVVNGLIICWVLTALFYYRKRHGIVGAWFLILYSISRVFLELIRQDNPLDVGGLTISQAISAGTFLTGVVWLWLMHAKMPLVSPRVAPFVFPEDEKPVTARKAKKK